MGKLLLITRPEHDITTHYLSKWSERIIKKAEEKGVDVVDLHKEKANRKRVVGILEKREPGLAVLNGHGSENFVTGHDNKVILRNSDAKAVKSKIIFARSCRSAKGLGQESISHGANAYLGYRADFLLLYSTSRISKPLGDKTAKLFLEPSNAIAIALLKGHTAGFANSKSKLLFRKNIEELLTGGSSGDDYHAIRFLYWDMINQVCLGNKDAVFD